MPITTGSSSRITSCTQRRPTFADIRPLRSFGSTSEVAMLCAPASGRREPPAVVRWRQRQRRAGCDALPHAPLLILRHGLATRRRLPFYCRLVVVEIRRYHSLTPARAGFWLVQ